LAARFHRGFRRGLKPGFRQHPLTIYRAAKIIRDDNLTVVQFHHHILFTVKVSAHAQASMQDGNITRSIIPICFHFRLPNIITHLQRQIDCTILIGLQPARQIILTQPSSFMVS
jgi:hypothetical protein